VTTIRTSVEDRQRADAAAAKRGLSLNTLIVEALRKEVERDGDK
jgi:predicted HicB family RNase H-like nuclease